MENLNSAEVTDNQYAEPDLPEPSTNEPDLSQYDTIVLSGGSTKGFILLGALQYMYDTYLLTEKHVTNYIGTSAGFMICYLLCIGYTPAEILIYICKHQLLEKMQYMNVVAMINGEGAMSFSNIYENLERMTIDKLGYCPTFRNIYDSYKKKLCCCTYNFTQQKVEYISYDTHPDIPCLIAIRMTSNLPLIFEKFKYGSCFYIDGGVGDNFPIDIGDEMGKKILGLLLETSPDDFNADNEEMNVLEFIYKVMFIPINQITETKLKNVSEKCTIIKLNSKKLKFFNFQITTKMKLELFSSGYQETKNFFNK